MRRVLRSLRDHWDDMVMVQEIERAAAARDQTEREVAAAPSWEEQAELPLLKRDGLWWTGVAFPTVVLTLAMFAVSVIVVFVL